MRCPSVLHGRARRRSELQSACDLLTARRVCINRSEPTDLGLPWAALLIHAHHAALLGFADACASVHPLPVRGPPDPSVRASARRPSLDSHSVRQLGARARARGRVWLLHQVGRRRPPQGMGPPHAQRARAVRSQQTDSAPAFCAARTRGRVPCCPTQQRQVAQPAAQGVDDGWLISNGMETLVKA